MSADLTSKAPSTVGVGWTRKFAELDIPTLQQFILDNPLGILVTSLPNDNFESNQESPELQSTHIPFVLDKIDLMGSELQLPGMLRGRMTRESPHSKALVHAVARQSTGEMFEDLIPAQIAADQCLLEEEVMILFNGPTASYVSPSFYTKTMPQTGKVVPNWNYSCVQAYGKLKLYCDFKSIASVDFLKKQVTDLTKHGEETLMGFPESRSWKFSDAPNAFIDNLIMNVIGVEVTITRLEGKNKIMQEMEDPEDKLGVIRGFRALRTTAGELVASGIEKCMAKDPKVSGALEGEDVKQVLGKKVKGKFGWYFTAADPTLGSNTHSDHADAATTNRGIYVPTWLIGGFIAIQVVSLLMFAKCG